MVNRSNPLRSVARTAAALLIVLVALVAAGCGSSSPGADTTQTTTASGASGGGPGGQTAGLAAFQTCLKQHGITTPGGFGRPRGGSGGTPPPPSTGQAGTPPAGTNGGAPGGFAQNLTPAQQKAFTACRSKLPAGASGFGQRGTRPGQAANPALAKYTKCLSQHGIKFGSTSSSTTAFKKASAACAKNLPTGAGGNQPPATTVGK
jgi:hypothetical protein